MIIKAIPDETSKQQCVLHIDRITDFHTLQSPSVYTVTSDRPQQAVSRECRCSKIHVQGQCPHAHPNPTHENRDWDISAGRQWVDRESW